MTNQVSIELNLSGEPSALGEILTLMLLDDGPGVHLVDFSTLLPIPDVQDPAAWAERHWGCRSHGWFCTVDDTNLKAGQVALRFCTSGKFPQGALQALAEKFGGVRGHGRACNNHGALLGVFSFEGGMWQSEAPEAPEAPEAIARQAEGTFNAGA